MRIKICNPEGISIEARVRRLRRYIESRREDFEDEGRFIRWADKTAKSAIGNMARDCYVETQGGLT